MITFPTGTTGTSRTRRYLLRSLALAVVAACAVGPWFVSWPWQQQSTPTADPSAIIKLAHSEPVTGQRADAGPRPAPVTTRDLTVGLRSAQVGYDQPVSAAAAAGVRTTPGRYHRVARLRIPRLGLDVPVGEGVYADTLLHGPGHWPGTPMPGQEGNTVISGHRNTHTHPFKYLNELRHGDKVITKVGSDPAVTYRVISTSIVKQADYKTFVVQQPVDPAARMVTMFACHPEGNPIYRIVVRAVAEPTKPR